MKKALSLTILTLICFTVFFSACGSGYAPIVTTEPIATTEERTMTTSVPTTEQETQPKTTEEQYIDPIVGTKTTFTDLGLGEIARVKNYYIGLQYVKSMSYVPTSLDTKAEVAPNCVAILAFFEFFNADWDTISIDPSVIVCYADGFQVGSVQNTLNVEVDGAKQFIMSTKLDSLFRIVSVQDFEVPKDWKELTFYYNDNCIWTVYNEDVSTEDYVPQKMIWSTEEHKLTQVDEIIYSDRYQVQFKGYEFYRDKYFEQYYIIFKFCMTNNTDQTINTQGMGYSMRAYQNGTRLEDPQSMMSENIDGYLNAFKVDSIAPKMSSNYYLAFEVTKEDSEWQLVYDDGGRWESHYCTTLYLSDFE